MNGLPGFQCLGWAQCGCLLYPGRLQAHPWQTGWMFLFISLLSNLGSQVRRRCGGGAPNLAWETFEKQGRGAVGREGRG